MGVKQDIEDAIQAHGAWKAKFRDYLSGKAAIDLDVVGQTHCCKLGQWLEHVPQVSRCEKVRRGYLS